ncbi:hypothetical protein PsorP6_000444 [Peronosclerospora sorghi]|uniref:Uncharacterized protein n=1 Tax=Peronosclerospora sorghi TaxID=230839 RepID=A0ACC0WW70_9STRA|nr:hypothetical protein PsorP6_000444 [Peronosclerospora sorghi]
MKGKYELVQVQKTLLLCDAKMAYPPEFGIGSFFSSFIKLDAAHVAIEFLRQEENVRFYVKNQSFVRLAENFDSLDDQDTVDELQARAHYKQDVCFSCTKFQEAGKWDDAVALAKEAANAIQINSHLIIQLLQDEKGNILKDHIPLAKYLADKGEVYVNAQLADILAGGDGKLQETKVEESRQSENATTSDEEAMEDKDEHE